MEKRMKQWLKRGKQNNAGFTLVEVILSMTILALVFIPLMKYFSDSLKHSTLTAKRQQATMLAQSVSEQLKAGDALVKMGDSGYEWNVPGFTQEASTLNATTGVGDATFKYNGSTSFDLVLKLERSKETEPDRKDRTVVYGIDDTQDILAVEREQGTEALFYFMSINYNYVLEQHDLDPTSTVDYLTFDQIRNLMTRTIHLSVDKDTTTGDYLMQMYYKYSCKGLRGNDPLGNPIEDTVDSDFLLDIRSKKLTSLYLLYDRMNVKELDTDNNVKKDGTGRDIVTGIKYDTMYVTKGPGITSEDFVLILVCQNLEDSKINATSVDNYEFMITSSAYPTAAPSPLAASDLVSTARTNILSADNTGMVKNGSGAASELKDTITQKEDTFAPLKVTIEVYKAGHTATDQPYIVVNTTKGE